MRHLALLAVAATGVALLPGTAAFAAPPSGPPAATSAAGPVAARGDKSEVDTVYEVTRSATGYTVTVYDPAPGISNDQLRGILARDGHRPLAKGEDPRAVIARQTGSTSLSATAAVSAACQYSGTAAEWCGHRWANNGFEDPAVYFLDHTSSAWPVTAATNTWYQAQGIDAYYRWYTNGCPGGGRHCVNVYNGAYGSTGWVGLTSWPYDSTGDFDNTTNVTVKLNDSYGGTAAQHRNTTCHELGHALGLDHNASTNSCMYYARTSQLYPSSDDFRVLVLMYGY